MVGEVCFGSCPKVNVPWSPLGDFFGVKSRQSFKRMMRGASMNLQQLRQFEMSEVVVFAYLMLQVVSMVVEAATGRSRSRTKTIVASATMFVVIMLEFSFFGPTQAPFSRLFSQLIGWIVLALACL